jgi:hypothetical protein
MKGGTTALFHYLNGSQPAIHYPNGSKSHVDFKPRCDGNSSKGIGSHDSCLMVQQHTAPRHLMQEHPSMCAAEAFWAADASCSYLFNLQQQQQQSLECFA